jgi:hypothetical protein
VLIKRVWIEPDPEVGFDPATDSADVLVELALGVFETVFAQFGNDSEPLALLKECNAMTDIATGTESTVGRPG